MLLTAVQIHLTRYVAWQCFFISYFFYRMIDFFRLIQFKYEISIKKIYMYMYSKAIYI